MNTPNRSTALITGASSGIGLELAKLFAADKHDVVLTARSTEKLESLSSELKAQFGIQAHVVAIDLSKPNASEELVNRLSSSNIHVDYLVNNAGFGNIGNVAAIPLQRQSSMIQVNVMALMELTRLLLPAMIQRGQGGILNVGSTAAFQSGPGMAVYYATKAFVLSFSDALHEELRTSSIRVTCLAPGPTATGFGEDSGMQSAFLFRLGTMSASQVALAGYNGFKRNRALVIPGLKNQLGAFSARFTPRFLLRRIVAQLNRVTGK